jgi:hypothetical protein
MDKARWEKCRRGVRRGGKRNTTVHVSSVGWARWKTGWLRHRHELAVGWSAGCLGRSWVEPAKSLGLSFGLAELLHGSATSRESKQTSPECEGRGRWDVADAGRQKNLVNC